jgi:hypothetical protein
MDLDPHNPAGLEVKRHRPKNPRLLILLQSIKSPH